MRSAKVVVMSTGALSAAVALRLAASAMSAFLCAEVPRICAALLLWLTPPYLYLVINAVIISIAASSRFQKPALREEEEDGEVAPMKAYVQTQPEEPPPPVVFEIGDGAQEEEDTRQEGFLLLPEAGAERSAAEEEAEEALVISRSSRTRDMRAPAAAEKPPVSRRFGGQTAVKASPEGIGRALGAAKPRRYETLEGTWKSITDGRPMPLARHLKKSDTWGADRRPRDEATPPMRKTETFKEPLGTSPSPGTTRGRQLRRELSPGQDELNRRVEAFIRKFNEEMRLQRQESFQNYMDMINQAA